MLELSDWRDLMIQECIIQVAAAFVGTITNTILFLGAFYLFAKDACMAQFGAATADALFKMMLGVVTLNGIIEAVTSVIICTAVGQALYNFIFKKTSDPS